MLGSEENLMPYGLASQGNLLVQNLLKFAGSWAHAYNPSYSGGRDQEDCGSKPAHAISL
jgi:hypothetical protein